MANNNFGESVTQVNSNNNEGLENVGNLKNNLENIGKLLGKAKSEFEKFDISNEANKSQVEDISGQNESGKAIVDMMASVRDSSDKDLSEQLSARKMLGEIRDKIEKSNTLSEEQKSLLSSQARILESGFSNSAMAFNQAKKSIAEYSDVAVAGFTSIMGNSPVTLFLSKMLVDQTKAFFQRRKDVKANMAKLEKAEAIDNLVLENSTENTENTAKTLTENESQSDMMKWSKRFAKIKFMWDFARGKKPQPVRVVSSGSSTQSQAGARSGSLATQVKEENRREGLKKKTGAKFKAVKESKSPFVKMLLMAGRALLFLLSPLKLLGMGIGLAATLFKSLAGGITGLLGKLSSLSLPGRNPTSKRKGKGKSKLSGLKNMVKGSARFLGPVGAVAGAGAAGYAAGSYINDTFLTNEDGSGKIANFADRMINGSEEEKQSKRNSEADKMAQSRGFKNFKELKSHNDEIRKKKAAGIQITTPQISPKETTTSSNISSIISEHTSQIKELRSQQVNAITSNRAELEEKERDVQPEGKVASNVAVSSTTNNNATTIAPPQRPINIEKNFIAASMSGAL